MKKRMFRWSGFASRCVLLGAFLSLFLGIFPGFAAEFASGACSETPALDLHRVSVKDTDLNDPVSVMFSLEKDAAAQSWLVARFDVRTKEIYAKTPLAKNEYPYQRDVVEIFVSVAATTSENVPYYEFELSPYDQDFQVIIESLKKPFKEGVQLGMKHSVKKNAIGWTGEIRIPLEKLGWAGDVDKIIGNAFSIFGAPENRSFWSLYLPPMKKPNFHQPQFFKSLLNCPSKV
jgi:hypothetical protein